MVDCGSPVHGLRPAQGIDGKAAVGAPFGERVPWLIGESGFHWMPGIHPLPAAAEAAPSSNVRRDGLTRVGSGIVDSRLRDEWSNQWLSITPDPENDA